MNSGNLEKQKEEEDRKASLLFMRATGHNFLGKLVKEPFSNRYYITIPQEVVEEMELKVTKNYDMNIVNWDKE